MFNMTDFRVKAVHERAEMLVALTTPIAEAAGYLEETIETRNFFSNWYGEHSKEFLLANSVVVLLRMLRNSNSEVSNLEEWINEQPIRRSWFMKIDNELRNGAEAA
ncbi:hypothetical protein [Rheinheimera hassiensis]|uniref:hypothetical protein n=1 Tax=Rheinheimera hassiensis TaxID=1193627 RepID=UPI001F06D56C|nr:hypothetical protein [Rheinheimera hassiensis]